MRSLNLDDDPRNRDWTKRTWDLPYRTVEEVRVWLEQRGVTVEEFRTTATYLNALPNEPWLADL